MKRSHVQTGGLLAAGLAVALVVHFWPAGDATEAIPAYSQSPTASASSASPTPTTAPVTTPSPEVSASPSVSASAMPSASSGTPSGEEPREGGESPAAAVRTAITGLEVRRNNTRTVMVGWDPAPGASRYAVYSNGGLIARVPETNAVFIWETDALTIGIAAETLGGAGPVSTIRVQRPSDGTTAAPSSPPPPATTTAPAPDPTSQPAETPSTPVVLPEPTVTEVSPPPYGPPPSKDPENNGQPFEG